jgi:hypothetical protein
MSLASASGPSTVTPPSLKSRNSPMSMK